MEQVFLADVINWVGVATGVIGAVVVAPSGFQELVRTLVDLVRRLLPRKPQHHYGSGSITLPVAFSVGAEGHRVIDEGAPIEEQVRQLVRNQNRLWEQMARVNSASVDRDRAIRERIDRVATDLSGFHAEMRERMDAADRATARFNARGLPLVAMGTLMTGPNGILAENIVFGWILVAAAIGLVVYGIWPWRPWMPAEAATSG